MPRTNYYILKDGNGTIYITQQPYLPHAEI